MDVIEGPALSTEEWVEHEVLQSGSGWIELAKQCLVSPLILSSRLNSAYDTVVLGGVLLTCQFP